MDVAFPEAVCALVLLGVADAELPDEGGVVELALLVAGEVTAG